MISRIFLESLLALDESRHVEFYNFRTVDPGSGLRFKFGRGEAMEACNLIDIFFNDLDFGIEGCAVILGQDTAIPLLLGMRFLGTTDADISCRRQTVTFSFGDRYFSCPLKFSSCDMHALSTFAAENVTQDEMKIIGKSFSEKRQVDKPGKSFALTIPDDLRKSLSKQYPKFKQLWHVTTKQLWNIHLSRHSPAAVCSKVVADMVGFPNAFDADVKQFLSLIHTAFVQLVSCCERCARGGRRETFSGLLDTRGSLNFLDRCAADYIVHAHWAWLVLLDYSTHFIWIVTQSEKPSKDSFYSDIVHFGSIFGLPRCLTLDRDGVFHGAASMVEALGVRVTWRAGETHAQSGRIERVNLILRECFRKETEFLKNASFLEVRTFADFLVNCLNNETSRSSSSASLRTFGFSTDLRATALSDTQHSAFSDCPTRERAREVFFQVIGDVSLRKQLSARAQPEHEIFAPGQAVFYYRPSFSGKTKVERHTGTVLCFESASGNYLILALTGAVLSCSPRDVSLASVDDFPQETFFREFAPADFQVNAPQVQQVPEFQGPALLRTSEVHVAHVQGAVEVECPQDDVTVVPNLYQKFYEQKMSDADKTSEELDFWAIYDDMQKMSEHSVPPRPSLIESFDENAWLIQDFLMTASELNKYALSWDDLDAATQQAAYDKAISSFYKFGVWKKGHNERLTRAQVDELKKKFPELVMLDSSYVKKAKISGDSVIGKVRLVIRGFKDYFSDTSQDDSPTVTDLSSRLCELFGISTRRSLTLAEVKLIFQKFPGLPYLTIVDGKLVKRMNGKVQGPRLLLFEKVWFETMWSCGLDASDAFFNSMELVHMLKTVLKLPRELVGNREMYQIMHKEAPGMRGASRSWYDTLKKKILEFKYDGASFTASKLDSALFLLWHAKLGLICIVPIHVDDSRIWGYYDVVNEFRAFLEKSFPITFEWNGDGLVSDFNGQQWTTDVKDDGTRISTQSQNQYIAQKLKPIPLEKNLDLSEEVKKDSKLYKAFETAMGCLIWCVTKTQKHASYNASFLASCKPTLKIADLIALNETIENIRARPVQPQLSEISGTIKIVGILDGAELATTSKRGQIGRIIGLCSGCAPGISCIFNAMITRSQRAPRVTHASFDVECVATIAALDDVLLLRAQVAEFSSPLSFASYLEKRTKTFVESLMSSPSCDPELHSDSMGVVRSIRSTLPTKTSNRRREDIGDLRESIELGLLHDCFHIAGPTNPSDSLTKLAKKCSEVSISSFLTILCQNVYSPDFLT